MFNLYYNLATLVRDRSSPKVKEEQPQEQIYAEIPDQPVQPTHSQNTPEKTATEIQAGTRTAILLSGGISIFILYLESSSSFLSVFKN